MKIGLYLFGAYGAALRDSGFHADGVKLIEATDNQVDQDFDVVLFLGTSMTESSAPQSFPEKTVKMALLLVPDDGLPLSPEEFAYPDGFYQLCQTHVLVPDRSDRLRIHLVQRIIGSVVDALQNGGPEGTGDDYRKILTQATPWIASLWTDNTNNPNVEQASRVILRSSGRILTLFSEDRRTMIQ